MCLPVIAPYMTQKERDLLRLFHRNGSIDRALIPKEIKLAMYCIFQESLNNAAKHAQAGWIETILEIQPDLARLEVQDDGVGFEVPDSLLTWVEQGKLGLASMRERADGAGGTFHVESRSDHGTRVFADVPLP